MSEINFEGSKNKFSLTMDNGYFDVLKGSSLDLTGSLNDLDVELGSGAVSVTGDDNWVRGTDGSTLSANGYGNELDGGAGSVITLNGTFNAACADAGSFITMTGDKNGAWVGAGSFITMNGRNNSVWSDEGSTIAMNGTSNAAWTDAGSYVTVNGEHNSVWAAANTHVTANGNFQGLWVDSGSVVIAIGDYNNIKYSDSGASMTVTVTGTNNIVSAGAGSVVTASGGQNSVNLQANSHVLAYSGTSVRGSNDVIDIAGNVNVTGNNNAIHGDVLGQSAAVYVTGSNNVVSMAKGVQAWLLDTYSIGGVRENEDGSIEVNNADYFSGATLVDGLLSLHFYNGNVATFANVASGTHIGVMGSDSWTTIQDTGSHPYVQSTNQLVSAMAGYNADAGAATTVSASQSSNDVMFHPTLVAA